MGRAIPGGRIDIQYWDGTDVVAADAGDYVYPADVRFDPASDTLYVKASGDAVIGGSQTWLFKYDLASRRQVQHAQVDPSVLPKECPVANSR